MSWKESKVRLLPPLPPQALNPQDRKPDIQDLFLLASQATALRNTPLSSAATTIVASEHNAATTTVSVMGSNPVLLPSGTHLQQSPSVQYPPSGTSIVKIEPVIQPSSSISPSHIVPLDSAMMPPPPPPPPRPPVSPGVSSTSGDSDFSDTAQFVSPNLPANQSPNTANNHCQQLANVPPQSLGKGLFIHFLGKHRKQEIFGVIVSINLC